MMSDKPVKSTPAKFLTSWLGFDFFSSVGSACFAPLKKLKSYLFGTKPVESAKKCIRNTTPADCAKPADSTKPVGSTKLAKPSSCSKPADSTKLVGSTKSAKPSSSSKPADSTTPADSNTSAHSTTPAADSTKPAIKARPAEGARSTDNTCVLSTRPSISDNAIGSSSRNTPPSKVVAGTKRNASERSESPEDLEAPSVKRSARRSAEGRRKKKKKKRRTTYAYYPPSVSFAEGVVTGWYSSQDGHWGADDLMEEEEESQLPLCPYGIACYIHCYHHPQHFCEYYHGIDEEEADSAPEWLDTPELPGSGDLSLPLTWYSYVDRSVRPDLEIYTDTSGTQGCGAYFRGDWFHYDWEPHQQGLGTDWKELFAIFAAAHTWGHLWEHKRILVHCDNLNVVQIWERRKHARNLNVLELVSKLFAFTENSKITVTMEHLHREYNEIADALSKKQFGLFFYLAPYANRVSTPTPQLLREI